jgi:16S rRNA (guanine966-N2)-methyltransferase
MAGSKNTTKAASTLRIIGGQWRSRQLKFTPAEGLRPTSDRIRETLFNWLAPVTNGAHCADLFAGSGALGLEALSRGAAHCDFVDTSATALAQIAKNLTLLDAKALGNCHRQAAKTFIEQATLPIDILFIDPPFARGLIDPICHALSAGTCLAEEAWVYIETPRSQPPPDCPKNWLLHRNKATGDVAYRLFRVTRP